MPQPNPNSGPSEGSNANPEVHSTFFLGGIPFSVEGHTVFAGSETILPGGSPATYNGMIVSLASSANEMVIGSSTIILGPTSTTPAPAPAVTFQIGASVYTITSAGPLTVGSQTLTPGGIITVDGTPVSLAPSATAIVVGTSTVPLSQNGATPAASLVLTLGSSTFTEDFASNFVIGTQTLTPGGMITVDGVVIALAPGATQILVGSNTQALEPLLTSTSPANPGGVIYSAFGGGGDQAQATATQNSSIATGKASGRLGSVERCRYAYCFIFIYFIVGSLT